MTPISIMKISSTNSKLFHLLLIFNIYQVSFAKIHFRPHKVKIYVSVSINNVIMNEVDKGPIVIEASQLPELYPLLKSNVSRVIVNSNAKFSSFPPSGTIILLAKPRELSKLLLRSSFTDCKYILIADNLGSLKDCFKAFWKYKILNVVALVQSFFHRIVKVITYQPFGSKCGDTRPKLIDARLGEPNKSSIFPDLRKLKFNHCNLSFTAMDEINDITISKTSVKIKGGLMKVFVAVTEHLEMGLKLWTGEEYWDAEALAGSKWKGIPGYVWEVLTGNADFALGRFSWMYHNFSGSGFPMQIGMECITWAVPYGVGPLPSSWLLYTYQFSSLMWILSILAVLIAGMFLALLEPRLSVPYLAILRILLLTGSNKLPASESSRVFLLHWAIYSLVFTAAYQASTGSLVLVPPESGNIATQEQVIKSDLILFADIEMYRLCEKLDFGDGFKEDLVLYPNYKFINAVYRVYSRKDAAVLSSERNIKYAWNTLRRLTNDTHIISILPICLFKSPTSIFLVREGSFVEAPLHRSLRYLAESGILKLWENVLEDEPPPRNFSQFKSNHPLSVHQTSGAFYILASGYALSIFIFFLEVTYVKRKTINEALRIYVRKMNLK